MLQVVQVISQTENIITGPNMQNGRRKRQSISRKSVGSQNGPKPAKRIKLLETKGHADRRNPTFPGGVLLTFGQGDVGQLGLGPDILEKGRPTLIPQVEGVVDVCAGGMHTIYLNNKGEVWSFGCNDEGALGRDTSVEGSETEPGLVELPGQSVQITAGDSHSAALLDDGRVFAWGSFRDSHGTMGLTPQGGEKVPVEVLPNLVVHKISSGADHLVMLSDDGQLYTVGCGEQGQLGRLSERVADRSSRQGLNHLLIPALVPFQLRKKLEFVDIWTGTYCTFAKDKSGHIYVFGLNNYNQLGLEQQKSHYFPSLSSPFDGYEWINICGGQHHTLALDKEGKVYSLGRREYGRLGLGEDCSDTAVPTLVSGLDGQKCVDIGCEGNVSYAVTDDGKLYSWGMGSNMQLGNNDDSDLWVPTQVTCKALEGCVGREVSAGGQHTVLLASKKSSN